MWLNFLYLKHSPKKKRIKPLVTLCVPAYNEESTILKTLNSLIKLRYKNTEVFVVDDGSKDNTASVVNDFIKANPECKITLISKKNGGKSAAVNTALDAANGELFGVVDADSRLDPKSLSYIVPHFADVKCGAVISHIRVDSPRNFLERIQRFEYVMSNMFRKIMHNLGTLCITPGVLSVYNTKIIRKLGGFVRDSDNLTEDYEIALRLKDAGYTISMEPRSVTYTKVPSSIDVLWKQRIRWCRGFVYNHIKYKHLIFSRKHGFLGTFQIPVNLLGVAILIFAVSLFTIDFFNNTLIFISRSLTIPDYFFTKVMAFPTLKEFLLARNVQVSLPILISFALGLYMMIYAVKFFKENLRSVAGSIVAYSIIVPYFSAANWIASIYHELFKTKRKW